MRRLRSQRKETLNVVAATGIAMLLILPGCGSDPGTDDVTELTPDEEIAQPGSGETSEETPTDETATGGTPTGSVDDTATLSWIAPTTNMDGTPLSDLASFRIHYGTTSGTYTQVVDVLDPNATGQTITGLSPNTYYFAVTAYDLSGNESVFSNEVSWLVQ